MYVSFTIFPKAARYCHNILSNSLRGETTSTQDAQEFSTSVIDILRTVQMTHRGRNAGCEQIISKTSFHQPTGRVTVDVLFSWLGGPGIGPKKKVVD
eukprot:604916-Amorphochlora_amoeboformis.AAC.1